MTDFHFLVTLQVKNCNVTKKDLRHGHFIITPSIYHNPIICHIKTLNIKVQHVK